MEQLVKNIVNDLALDGDGPWMLPEATVKSLILPANSKEVLVIGIGGSTLRLTNVTFSKNSPVSHELMSMGIPKQAKADNLFKWCASELIPAIEAFCNGSNLQTPPPICVSWSFPLHNGCIVTMGKEFSQKFDGLDLLTQFNAELPERYHIKSALHDGTSSLLAGMLDSSRCKMALTLGTGVNINVKTNEGVLINTEISFLGRPDTTPSIELFKEPWDIQGSVADNQPLEAKVGGLYLGRMASSALQEEVTTLDLWKILSKGATNDKRYEVVDKIIERAASLVAASIYGVAIAMCPVSPKESSAPIEIAYTGGVIFEPEFRSRLERRLCKLSKIFGFGVSLTPQKHGSEIGAAISAFIELSLPQTN